MQIYVDEALGVSWAGVDLAVVDPVQEAIEMLQKLMTALPKHLTAEQGILRHAYKHLQGNKNLPLFDRYSKKYKDTVWTPAKQFDVNGELIVNMLDCVTGQHQYDEDSGPECQCTHVSACGCNINPDEMSTCEHCDQCNDCCEADGECSYCEGCSKKVASEKMCGKCDSNCKNCCSYHYVCDSCDTTKSLNYQCGHCSNCDGCCECWYCEGCGDTYSQDYSQCGDCLKCAPDCCDCDKECVNCSTTEGLCKRCGRCVSCVCDCPPPPPPPLPPYTAKTQKAKGLVNLYAYNATYYTPHFDLLKAEGADANRLVGKFVRPCPLTPRHGFVDSRMVNTLDEANHIIAETLTADKDAEFLLMKLIDADYSAVWTPGVIVLGPGNDGATAGRKSITVPVVGDYLHYAPGLLANSGVTNAPYVEMLWKDRTQNLEISGVRRNVKRAEVVQLRDGPKLPQQVDYVVAETTVANIVMAEGDLLEWETLMKNQPAGTVVYHPEGSLASHYAVHAVLNNIAVMISRRPVVGEKLSPSMDEAPKQPNLDEFRRGFYFGITADTDPHSACYMMLLGCHSTALWLGKHDVLLGAALGFTYRLTVTAGLGEWRHRPINNSRGRKYSREELYDKVWNKTHKIPRLYMETLKDFRTQPWSGGMGGEKWYEFTRWAGEILNALIEGDVLKAMEAMNQAVHASHNNGWGFNKFAVHNAMNIVAENPVHAVTYCGPLVYQAVKAAPAPAGWFAKTKPMPVHLAESWLDGIRQNMKLSTAAIAVAGLQDGELIVQFKNSKNSKIVKTCIVPVAQNQLAKVTDILKNPYYGLQNGFTGEGKYTKIQAHEPIPMGGHSWILHDSMSQFVIFNENGIERFHY